MSDLRAASENLRPMRRLKHIGQRMSSTGSGSVGQYSLDVVDGSLRILCEPREIRNVAHVSKVAELTDSLQRHQRVFHHRSKPRMLQRISIGLMKDGEISYMGLCGFLGRSPGLVSKLRANVSTSRDLPVSRLCHSASHCRGVNRCSCLRGGVAQEAKPGSKGLRTTYPTHLESYVSHGA